MASRYQKQQDSYAEYVKSSRAVVVEPTARCTEPGCMDVAVSWDGNRDPWCRFHSKQVNRGARAPAHQYQTDQPPEELASHAAQFERRSGETSEQYIERLRKARKGLRVFQAMP